jgi:type I restriction enzyme, S subunit
MSFPRYPEYKDSGVEWLGEVPKHWDVRRARRLCEIKKRIVGELGHEVLSITQQGIRVRDLESNDGQISMDYSKYQLVEVGDFAMNHMDLLTGYVDIAKVRGVTSPDYRVFSIRDSAICNEQYLLYLFQMGYKNRIFYAYGQGSSQLGRWRMPTEQFHELAFPLPPISEQIHIAAFLRCETAKIDKLVAEQQRLMELLKEKRQSVISLAVTKGLNPAVPLKPSGIEWLGDVPEHWDVLPIKRIVSTPVTDGPHETPNFIDEGVPFVSAEAVSSGAINFSKVRACISEEDNARYSLKYAPKLHDIYMVKSGATTGVTAIVEDRTDFNIWSPLAVIRCNSDSVPRFVLNFMRSKHFQEAVALNWSFGTQQNIGMGVIENLAVTVPPLAEQLEIAEILKSESTKFDDLTVQAQSAIDLLLERRTALVSSAVIGQVDVRYTTAERNFQ